MECEQWRAPCALHCSLRQSRAWAGKPTSTAASSSKRLARCARPGALFSTDMMPEGIELACCHPNSSSLLHHRQQAVRPEVLTPCCRGRRRRPDGPPGSPGTAPPGRCARGPRQRALWPACAVREICLRTMTGACMIVTPTVWPLMLPLGLSSPACHGVQSGQGRGQGPRGARDRAAGAGPAGAQLAPCQLWLIIFAGRRRLAPLRPIVPAYAHHSSSIPHSQS